MGGVVECCEGGRRWKKIWGPRLWEFGEEKKIKKCPEAKVGCWPCESEWRGGLPKALKNFRKKRKRKQKKKWGASVAVPGGGEAEKKKKINSPQKP